MGSRTDRMVVVFAARPLLLVVILLTAQPSHCRSFHDDAGADPSHVAGGGGRLKVRQVEGEEPDVTSVVSCTDAVCDNANNLPEWIQILYNGVSEVPTYNDFGNIMVFGEKAFPLLKMPDEDVTILAGAEVGNGRLLAASHNGYVDLFNAHTEHGEIEAVPTCRSTVQGEEYRGDVSVTVGGLTCQRWAEQTPHAHSYTDDSQFPDDNIYMADNYCRNPSGSRNKPWCYTTDPNKQWDYCHTPLCPGVTQDCRSTDKGTEYMGTVSVTQSGRTCQAWADQSPHSHNFGDHAGFPEYDYSELHNYCRNPGGDQQPWCYTTDPSLRWDYCITPACPDAPACRSTIQGAEYDGDVNTTVSGLTCQAWADQTPHAHSYTNINSFPDEKFGDLANSCRNPSGINKPWCYTTDSNKQWDYCDTPVCPGVTQDCRSTDKGVEYMGTINVTQSGRTCQAWADQSPHSHNYKNVGAFPDGSYEDVHNYCRNPGGDQQPWCYTADPSLRWDYCTIPACPGGDNAFAGNMRKWLTKGRYQGEENVCQLNSESSMSCLDDPDVLIAVWHDTYWASEEDEATVLGWVQAGGSLLWAIRAWSWQLYRTAGQVGEPYSKMPFYNVIEEAGMAFSYKWRRTNALPAPVTSVDIDALAMLNQRVMANHIQTVADSETYSAWVDDWLNTVRQGYSQWLYPKVMDSLQEVMAIVGQKLEAEMPWPTGSVENEVSIPVTSTHQRMYQVYYELGLQSYWRDKAINVDKFPGEVDSSVARESYEFEVGTKEENTWATGMYLPAGEEMQVTVLSAQNTDYTEFKILIGCHTDSLYGKTSLSRFPRIARWVNVDSAQMKISHVHGGLVQVQSPKSTTEKYIKIRFDGVVKAPYINLADPNSIAEWTDRRNAPGPWADIVGFRSRFTLPASSVRHLDTQQVVAVMEEWDDVVLHAYLLKGAPADLQRRQWATTDIQISNGFLHAGYPICTHLDKADVDLDVFVMNKDFIEQWGMFHEIGHNLQEWSWTFSDTIEVTTNIFSLFQKWRLFGMDPLIEQLNNTIHGSAFEAYLANPTYENCWKNPWTALLPYAQLAHHFGFNCFHKVFSTYYDDPNSPQGDQEGRDEWVRRWSEAVGYNLCPVYDFYSLTLSDDMCQNLPYSPFLPDDVITQKPTAAALTNQMRAKYPGTLQTLNTTPDCPSYDAPIQKRAVQTKRKSERSESDQVVKELEAKGRKRRLVRLLKDYLQELQ